MSSSNNTLDIKPIIPGVGYMPAASPNHDALAHPVPPEPEVSTQSEPLVEPASSAVDSANDPQAVAAARAQLAYLDIVPAQATVVPQKLPQPVSPVAEEHRRHKHLAAKPKLPSRLKPIVSAVSGFLLLVLLFKAPVLLSQLNYQIHAKQQPLTATSSQAAAVSPDPTISIPKINVNAPVVYEPSVQEADIQKALQNGIVHYGTTVVPGQRGNSVFVGHSSNDLWEPGNYKFVFVLLDKLVAGDQFSLNYQSTQYVYQITNVEVVAPNDLSVLNPTSTPTVTLITCTPPGTSWQRLVVQAKQISPDPSQVNPTPVPVTNPNQTILPGSAPGFTDQLKQLWHDLFGPHNQPNTNTPSVTQPQQLPSGL